MTRGSALLRWWRGIHPSRLEAVGLLILLAAALWEALALRRADDVLWQWVIEDLNAKLKHIFGAIGAGDPGEYARMHAQEFLEGDASVIDSYEEARRSLSLGLLGKVRATLFAFGSALVVLGKWRNGRVRTDHPE